MTAPVLQTTFTPSTTCPNRMSDTEGFKFKTWLLCWLFLPNLPFAGITLVGGPPRYPEIVICAGVGLLVRRLPYGIRLSTFVAMLVLMVISFVARMFNMNLTMVMSVAHFVLEINVGGSPEYVIGASLLLVTITAACWLLRRSSDFSSNARVFAAIAAAVLLASADYFLSRSTMGSYSRFSSKGASFSSATEQVGLVNLADGKTNIMLVMVEGMGELRNPAMRTRFDRIWMRPEVASRYEVLRGSTPFFGSTTNGEIRELCGHWGDYPAITEPSASCLPSMLVRRGYETTSIHPFHASFFDRDQWYPRIGFQRSVFGEQLLDWGVRLCPNVFAGACDRELPKLIAHQLASAPKPQFVYWLTLNSHLPIASNEVLRTKQCSRLGGEMDEEFPMICRLFAVWEDTADALYQEISRPSFPATHILIVGDHMPPLTRQNSRVQFDPERVPWIFLRHRG